MAILPSPCYIHEILNFIQENVVYTIFTFVSASGSRPSSPAPHHVNPRHCKILGTPIPHWVTSIPQDTFPCVNPSPKVTEPLTPLHLSLSDNLIALELQRKSVALMSTPTQHSSMHIFSMLKTKDLIFLLWLRHLKLVIDAMFTGNCDKSGKNENCATTA